MRTLVHLSDLHFGRSDAALIPCSPPSPAISRMWWWCRATSPSAPARGNFWRLALSWMRCRGHKSWSRGNHDVPLYNPVARFVRRLDKYQRYITPDLEPFYADDQIAIVGLNTARSWVFKGGRLNHQQMARIRQRLSAGADVVKIIVTHHPFDVPAGSQDHDIVGRARLAIQTFAACGVDLLLTGHLHVNYLGHTATRYKLGGYSALIVQAGTATSTRVRGEANTFNVIRIAWPHITVECLAWQPSRGVFVAAASDSFRQTSAGLPLLTHPR